VPEKQNRADDESVRSASIGMFTVALSAIDSSVG
jgi:hypothetical protein